MKVVMTGAAGGVGTMIRPHLRPHLDRLVLSIHSRKGRQ